MKRDSETFPDDGLGDKLWDMQAQGDNLSMPREFDFSMIFPTQSSALEFAVHLLRNGQKCSFSAYEEHDELPWQVQAHPRMKPTYKNISGYRSQLERDAKPYKGRYDGWGCFEQNS